MPKIVNKEEKREKLVQAAIPVFAKFGFRDAKMSDVAVSADVGKGTLYEYFESKDDLFLNIFKLWFAYLPDQMREIAKKESRPYQQLIQFFEQYFSTIEKYAELYYIYFDFWSELTRNPQINRQEIIQVYQSLREMFTQSLEEGISKRVFRPMNSTSMSITLLSLADGLLMQWLMDRDAFSISEVGIESLTSLLDSLKV